MNFFPSFSFDGERPFDGQILLTCHELIGTDPTSFFLTFCLQMLLQYCFKNQVLETNINLILQAIDDQGKMHQKSMKGAKVNESTGTDTVRQQLGAGNQWA